MTPPRGHMFYIGLYRKKYKTILLSERAMPRALIFDMKHHLVTSIKFVHSRGHMFSIGLYRENHIFLSVTKG